MEIFVGTDDRKVSSLTKRNVSGAFYLCILPRYSDIVLLMAVGNLVSKERGFSLSAGILTSEIQQRHSPACDGEKRRTKSFV